MIEARENVTAGDVISLCEGKACKGYGPEAVGRKATVDSAMDLGIISLGGTHNLRDVLPRWSSATQSPLHANDPDCRFFD